MLFARFNFLHFPLKLFHSDALYFFVSPRQNGLVGLAKKCIQRSPLDKKRAPKLMTPVAVAIGIGRVP
jgi:hypothetical protein